MDLVEVDYDDVYGDTHRLPDMNEAWINPSGRLRIKVAGEVGAITQVLLETKEGRPIEYAASAPLDGKDWISLSGGDTIGAFLSLPIPEADGNYRLTVRLVDASGLETTVAERNLGVDREPPEMTGMWRFRGGLIFDGTTVVDGAQGVALPNGAVIDVASAYEVGANGIVDRLSGVDYVRFYQTPREMNTHSEEALWRTSYDPKRETASMWARSPAVASLGDGEMRHIGFFVQDRAGNRAIFARDLRFAGPCRKSDAVIEALRSVDGNWAPISPDGLSQQETTGVRFRIPIDKSAQADPGLGLAAVHPEASVTGSWPPAPLSIDSLFARYQVTSTEPLRDLYSAVRSATALGCRSQQNDGDQAPILPPKHVPTIMAVQVSTGADKEKRLSRSVVPQVTESAVFGSQDSAPALIRLDAQTQIHGVRVEVSAQPYRQTVRMGAMACAIPTGAFSCEMIGATLRFDEQREFDVINEQVVVENTDTGRETDRLDVAFYRDRLLPEIMEHRLIKNPATIELAIAEERSETLGIDSGIAEVWVDAQGQDGQSARVQGTVEGERAGLHTAIVNLAGLAAGRYTLRAYARDLNDNVSFALTIPAFEMGAHSSALRLSVNGHDGSTPQVVESFESILVTDDNGKAPPASDIWFTISGGTDRNTTRVRAVHTDAGLRPGFVPLAHAPGDYSVSVLNNDANAHALSQVFTYKPTSARLSNAADLAIPAIARATRMADGSWPLTTTPVTRSWSGGAPVRGRHDLRVSLSPDATASLRVAEQDLHPGQSLIISGYDFDVNAQRIALPLGLADGYSDRYGYVGVLSIAVALPDVPALAMPVRTYPASSLITANWSKPAYPPGVRDARVLVRALNDLQCKDGVFLVNDALVMAPNKSDRRPGSTLCAIRWDSVPNGMGADKQTADLAGEVPKGQATMTARYQAGFAVIEDDGHATFVPSGEVVDVSAAVVSPAPSNSALLPHALAARSDDDWLAASGWPWDSWWEGVLTSRWITGANAEPPMILAQGVSLPTDAQTGNARVQMSATFPTQCFMGGVAAVGGGPRMCFQDRETMPVLVVQGPAVRHSEAPVVIRGRVAVARRNVADLAPPQSGLWRVTVPAFSEEFAGIPTRGGHEDVEGTTDGDGNWSLDLGRLAPGSHRIRVVAEPIAASQEEDCGEHLEVMVTLFVQDGSAITATLSESVNSGAIDTRRLIRIALSTSARAMDVKTIHWEAREDSAHEWEAIPRDGISWELDATDMNANEYRATLVNAYSGVVFTAALPVDEDLLAAPRLLIQADPPQGRRAKFSAHTEQGEPVRVAWGAWNVDRGWITELGGGSPTIDATLEEMGDWVVLAVHQDAAGRRTRALQTLTVGGDGLPRLHIEGPERAETGKTHRYSVEGIRAQDVGDDDMQWTLRWTLPDGTTHNGMSVDYTPMQGDNALLVTATRGKGAAQESITVKTSPSLWSYAWPDFALQSKGADGELGWDGVYVATTRSILRGDREGLSYQWEIPPGVHATGSGQERRVRFAPGVERSITVTIADMRGNSTTLRDKRKDPITPVTLKVKARTEDPWFRVPTNAMVELVTTGLGRGERIVGSRVWVNGALASDKLADLHEIPMRRAQVLQIDAEVTTSDGRHARGSVILETHEGEPPVCKLRISGDWRSALTAMADCNIAHGEIVGYHWLVEYGDTGEVRDFGVRAGRLSLDDAHLKRGIREIRMKAIDDRGIASSEVVREPTHHSNL